MTLNGADGKNYIRDAGIPSRWGQSVVCDLFHINAGREAYGPRPALIFMHGGGFVEGSKDQFFGMASWLAMMTDALCVTVEYRVAGQAACPAPILDCLGVAAWLYDHCEQFGICPELFTLVGGSSGAQIAAMAMLNGTKYIGRDVFLPVNGIFLNGIYDMDSFYRENEREQERVRKYLNLSHYDEEILREASPISHVGSGRNILLLHGEKDEVIPVSRAQRMKEALTEAGSRAWLNCFEDRGHAWFNKPEQQYEVLRVMEEFITFRRNEVLGNGPYKT